jgi:hypothetical protein
VTITAPTFQPGDRILCADGAARTVRHMAEPAPWAPDRVLMEDGTEWVAANCRRANPEDVAAARTISHHAAERVRRDPNPTSPQWRAALADLTAALDYLQAAEPDPIVRSAFEAGAESAARELEVINTHQETGPAETEEGRALRLEAAALLTVISQDTYAHAFQPVQPRGSAFPVAWTYRTGYGAAARYGWVTAGGRAVSVVGSEYRWQAENLAAASVRMDKGGPSPADRLIATPLDELRESLDRLRDTTARTRGTAPQHVVDDNVRAALEALEGCHRAEVPRHFNPAAEPGADDHDPGVTGLVIEPRGNGHVTAYWVEAGRYLQPNGRPWKAQLQEIRQKLQDAGWEIVPGGVRVVTAFRPGA